jgi:hypothetical protein
MTEPETPQDPRAMDDEELAKVPDPPSPPDPSIGSAPTAEAEYAEGRTSDSEDAQRDVPAGEDYAGSGF